ncbi:MAG: type II toxin-antitoxin system Phd/YefM family antitoxin [Kiritimatiellia bacterium]|nr:type II toxin-antitoxin system Phd/YefM family antitoxin [Kiritimatiellia bacterium]MDP7023352.1 type II toxin-antitoxin system Phd/YefM family antitoxin [Kiritimatiellia bacterium]
MDTIWTVQDAKNRFSQVVEHALHEGPQTITRRGKETAVLVSMSTFRSLARAEGDLVRFFQESPLAGTRLDLDRSKEFGRNVDL